MRCEDSPTNPQASSSPTSRCRRWMEPELCRRLRRQPVFAQLPIVLMSAAPEPAVGPPCWTMYLRKPVDLSSLLRALDCFVAYRLTVTSGSNPEADRRPRAGSRSTPAAGRSDDGA